MSIVTDCGRAGVAADRHRRRAVRYFWMWLTLTTAASLAGNVVHAWLVSAPEKRWLAAGVAMVAPVVLLLAVHGLAVLAKTSASAGRGIWWCSVVATAALAVGAFVLSFVALRDLAIIAGIHPALAPVLPLVVDLAIGVATLALVATAKPAVQGLTESVGATSVAVHRSVAEPAAAPMLEDTASRDRPAAVERTAAAPITDSATRELAAKLVAANITRKPVEVVARILAAHHAGDPTNRIAKEVGVHHSAVSKIIGAAQNDHTLEVIPA